MDQTTVPHAEFAKALALIDDLVDPDDCEFDTFGGCQAHGYSAHNLAQRRDRKCPNQDAKDFLARHATTN
jgi:hypothetical protein